jgi:hypothetical protein
LIFDDGFLGFPLRFTPGFMLPAAPRTETHLPGLDLKLPNREPGGFRSLSD